MVEGEGVEVKEEGEEGAMVLLVEVEEEIADQEGVGEEEKSQKEVEERCQQLHHVEETWRPNSKS